MNNQTQHFLSLPPFRVERSKSLHSALKKCTRSVEEKKVVSFADSMGLDLCQVRPIFPYNTSDEELLSSSPSTSANAKSTTPKPRSLPANSSSILNCPRYLHLRNSPFLPFSDPIKIQKELLDKAKKQGICLKSSNVIGMTFSGVISVLNVAFHKQVHVRYTLDDWMTYVDMPAHYLSSNNVENLDSFTFSIFLPQAMPVGARCQFCLRYQANGREFWDNNNDSDYILEVRTLADSYMDIHRDYEQPRFY